MNTLRLSILSLAIVMGVVTFGYVTPLQAQNLCLSGAFCDRDGDGFFNDHKRCEGCEGEADCDDSVYSSTNVCADTGGAQTNYSIEIVIGNDVTEETNTCHGFNTENLKARFPVDDCPISLDDELQGNKQYCLHGIEVRNLKKGTDAMFFVNRCYDPDGGEGVWNTRRLPAELVVGGPGDFKVTVNEPTGIVLIKAHQPNKGSTLDDTIFVGDIIYTIVP